MIAAGAVALLTPYAVLGPGADHALEPGLVPLRAVGGHVAGAALVGLLFSLVVEGPAPVLQIVLGLGLGTVFGSGDDVAVEEVQPKLLTTRLKSRKILNKQ